MTDRDFFAAAAMAGYLANPHVPDRIKDNIAFNAFAEADLMIEERPKDLTPIKPTLTDEERAALTLAWMNLSETARRGLQKGHSEEQCEPLRAASHTIRKLLERLS